LKPKRNVKITKTTKVPMGKTENFGKKFPKLGLSLKLGKELKNVKTFKKGTKTLIPPVFKHHKPLS